MPFLGSTANIGGQYGNKRTDHDKDRISSACINRRTAADGSWIYKGDKKEPGLNTLVFFYAFINRQKGGF